MITKSIRRIFTKSSSRNFLEWLFSFFRNLFEINFKFELFWKKVWNISKCDFDKFSCWFRVAFQFCVNAMTFWCWLDVVLMSIQKRFFTWKKNRDCKVVCFSLSCQLDDVSMLIRCCFDVNSKTISCFFQFVFYFCVNLMTFRCWFNAILMLIQKRFFTLKINRNCKIAC